MSQRAYRKHSLLVEHLETRNLLSSSPAAAVLVRVQPGQAPALTDNQSIAVAQGATVQATSVADVFEVKQLGPRQIDLQAAYAGQPYVVYVEPEATLHIDLTPNDPKFTDGTLYGLNGTKGIRAPAAWDVTTGSTRVLVADIDTGADYNHPDLYENIWINQAEIPSDRRANLTDVDGDGLITFYDLNAPANQGVGKITDINGDGRIDASDILAPWHADGTGGWADGVSEDGDTSHIDDLVGWNFVANNNDPFDDHGHGTHTSGTIGAIGNNATGVVGVNWATQIMVLKFLDSTGNGTDTAAADAIEYSAHHGARISSNSWGGSDGGATLQTAIQDAGAAGEIFVAAAGNSGVNTDVTPNYPSAYNLPNIVAVAATDSTGALASFSNYGPTTVDLGAPGVNIYSTYPTSAGSYRFLSGTSMATPHVAGTLALVLARNPTFTISQAINRLLASTTPDAALTGKTVSGGIVNAALAVQTPTTDLNWVGGGITGPASSPPNTPFTITRTYSISNVTAPSNFTIGYYSSTDTTFGNGDDILLGSETISAAVDKTVGTHTGTSPSLQIATGGSFYIFARVDDGNSVLETDETNNVARTASPMTVTGPIIVDNRDAGYSEAGSGWFAEPGVYGWYGPDARAHAKSAGAEAATWQVTGLAAGNYDVQATWKGFSDQATNATYQIYDGATLLASAAVDQSHNPTGTAVGSSVFQELGNVAINSGTLKVVLNDNANNYIIADAIRVAAATPPPPPPPLPAIVDNGTVNYSESGSGWFAEPGVYGWYGPDARAHAKGTGANTATWQVGGLAAGNYDVQATWKGFSDQATNATYRIFDGSTLVSAVSVDQSHNPSGVIFSGSVFQLLGTVTINSGTLRVVLSDSANNYVIADAVRVAVAAGPPPPPSLPAVVDNGTTGYSEAGGGWFTEPGVYGWYGPDARAHARGSGANAATWQLPGLAPGNYDVQATWKGFSDQATNATYNIFDGSTLLTSITVDQSHNPVGLTVGSSVFQELATVTINSGTLKVILSDSANNYIIADAIRVDAVIGGHSLFPSSTSRIVNFSDQLPSGQSNNLIRFEATHMAGTQKMTLEDKALFRAYNSSWIQLHYRLATSSGPLPYIHNDTWSSDWASVTSHEDWFLHDPLNQRLHNSNSNWDEHDIDNPAWRAYWVNSVIADMRATGSAGVFADSFEAGVGGFWFDQTDPRFTGTNAGNPAAWPGGITWMDRRESLINYIEAVFAATPEHFQYIPNIDAQVTGWENMDYSHADGAFLEDFGDWGGGYLKSGNPANWVLAMNRVLPLSGMDKILIMEPSLLDLPDSSIGQMQREFLLGTYLLLKGDHTYLNILAPHSTVSAFYFPEYGIDLGSAITPLASDVSQYLWNGVYRRDFQNGIVLVNPGNTALAITLPHTYQQVTGSGGGILTDASLDSSGSYIGGALHQQAVTSVTLAPGTAAILMN